MKTGKLKKQAFLWGLVAIILLGGGYGLLHYTEKNQAASEKSKTSEVTPKKISTATKTATSTETSQDILNADLPKEVALTDWDLQLVNQDHPIEKEPEDIVQFQGLPISEKIVPSLEKMFAAAKKENINLVMVSGYRSVDYQRQLFQQSIDAAKAKGMNDTEAKKEALRYRTEPGTSEHHTGIACDILDTDWQSKNGNLEGDYGSTPGGIWLASHGADYGFVVRYPKGKTAASHIEYEPWHMRYVGVENAQYMAKNNLCLEEYVALLEKR